MKKTALSFHYITLILICQVLGICFLIPTPVKAEDTKEEDSTSLTDIQRSTILMGCNSIKTSLRNLQKADSNTRVHLGTTYQNILTNYLTPLNLRLVKNNQLSSDLNSILSDYNKTRNDFNQQFITYSRSLENLIDLDCTSDPDAFYRSLQNSREERAKLAELVKSMRQILKDHVKAVKELKNV